MKQKFSTDLSTVHGNFNYSWGNVCKKIVFHWSTVTGLEMISFREGEERKCENCHVDRLY